MKTAKFLMVTSLCLVAAAATVWGDEVRIIGNRSSGNVSPWWGSSFDAMRFMALWTKADLGFVRGGYINKIEWERSSTSTGTFNNVRIYFCHSARTALDTTFNNNYKGTPVQVLNASTLAVTGTTGQWWDTKITPNEFSYNNTDNLLMEIRWRGDTGTACACYRADGTQKRMWANSDTATTGTVYNQLQRLRMTIANATGVAPTSLGRVKSLFR